MRKIKISSYIQRTKWIIIIIIAAILILFGRTVETPSLTKSAVVLGIGVDYSQDTKEFEVTTQSVLVGASTGDTSQTTYNTYTGKGKTIAGALDDVSRKMGLIVSLAHCNVLFVSTEVLRLDHFQLIYPLVVMYELPEQAIVVSGDKSPQEMLAIRIGTTVSAPYFLQSSLINEEGSDGMIRTTAKDFLARSLSRSHAAVIPYIKATKLEDQPMTGQEDLKDNYEFDLSQSLAFSREEYVIIEKEMAEILALYFSNDVTGSLNYTAENGETVEFKILDKDIKVKANKRNISAEMELSVDLLDIQHVDKNAVLTGADGLIIRYANELAQKIQNLLAEMFEMSKELNIDFLNLQAKAYQSVGRYLEEDCLGTLSFSSKVSIKVEEAS